MALIFQIGVIRCIVHGVIPDIDIECAQSTAKKALNINDVDEV